MDARPRCVALLTLGLGCVAFAGAAEVRVVDHTGAPVPDAMVVCLGREVGNANTGPDGVAMIPDACKKVWCERGGFVGVEATVKDGKALCRFAPAVILAVAPLPAGCADEPGCLAALTSATNRDDSRSDMYHRPPPMFQRWATKKEFRFTPTRPGRYRLSVERLADRWSCGADLGEVAAGQQTIPLVWREPAPLRGIVLGADEKPRAGIRVQVRLPLHQPGSEPPTVWHCSSRAGEAAPITSAADGAFTVLVDPSEKPTIEAGAPDDPEGYAAVILDSLPQGPLVLKLRPPTPNR